MNPDQGVNRTDFCVVYNPAGAKHRSVLQITLRPGKNLDEEMNALIAEFIDTALRIEKALSRDSEPR
jgi:hypothetical protein